MGEQREDGSSRDRIDSLEARYRAVARRLCVMLTILTVAFIVSGYLGYHELQDRVDDQRAQQRALAKLEAENLRASREAKMRTCIDLNEIRSAIRGVLRESRDNPDPGEQTPEREERLQRFIDHFAAVDCEKRVQEIFEP